MNPKAICADMAFHHLHDMQAFYRMHNVKRLPTGQHTPWPIRAEMGVRLFKNFHLSLVDTASENLNHFLPQITPAQLMRKAATVRNTQITSSDKTPLELAMGRRPRDLLDPASMNPEQLTSTPTNQDLLNEEIQKLAMKTHLEVQQREDIRRDLAERMKFVPPDLRAGENVFYWKEDWGQNPARTDIWHMVVAIKGPNKRTWSMALLRVWRMFSDNSYLSAILDRQGLLVAAPVDLRTKKAENFTSQLLQGFWYKLKSKNPKVVVMSLLLRRATSKTKLFGNTSICVWPWQNTKSLAENTSLLWDQNQKEFDGWKRYNIFRKSTIVNGPSSAEKDQPSGFFTTLAICYDR